MDYPKRKHPRLKEYDYSQCGVYFLTLCSKNREPLFSRIVGRDAPGAPPSPAVELTPIGEIVDRYIASIESAYSSVTVDKYIIMPDHVHMLIAIHCTAFGASGSPRPTELIPRVIAALKRFTNKDSGRPLWQTGYYDHIIRDEHDYMVRWHYIDANPAKWRNDELNSPPTCSKLNDGINPK